MTTEIINNWKATLKRPPSTAVELHQKWCECFAGWDLEAFGPPPIWFPTSEELEHSNVATWMRELGHETYQEFHQWTVTERGEFWKQSIDKLGILFHEPPTQILDVSQGTAKPAWFTNARLNIAESCFQSDSDATAIIAQSPGKPIRKWTYGELEKRASRVANSLVDHGFKVGDAIGVVMPMTDWSVAIYLGIVMAGCNVVSIADSFAPPEIAMRLEIAGAKAVFTYDHQVRAGKQLPLFRKVAQASNIQAIVLSCDDLLSLDIRDQDFEWNEFLSAREEFEPIPCTVHETINVLFSSGTTGEPKAIPWSHLTPIKCAIDGYCHQNIQAGDVCAWPTNLGWMMGPWLIFASLMNRATIALYEDAPVGSGFGQFIQDSSVTMLGVVPTIVKAWQSSSDMESFDWSAIKVFSSTGESSQTETMVYLSALAGIKPIIEYCGGTEIGGGYVSSVVVLPNFPASFNTAAVGLDFVLIEPEEESEVIENAVQTTTKSGLAEPGGLKKQELQTEKSWSVSDQGEVFLVPPSIGLSVRLVSRDHYETYYQATPVVEGIGQLRRHGDYFRRRKTEWCDVFIAGGRADDTMNLGGIKTSSAEIERTLNRINGVVETAAIAVSESGGPSRLVVFAVVDESNFNQAEKLKEMNQRIKSELNPLFRVAEIKVIESMPRTASGKVMRRKLRDAFCK
jgi:acetyl-CoA synthetase